MQNLFVKFSIIIFVLISNSLAGQGIYKALNKADSLYISKKYAEAYTDYLHIFEQGKYTPQMLLKMAYVKEGLGEVPEALYYLNVYYVNFPGRNILKKMGVEKELYRQGVEPGDTVKVGNREFFYELDDEKPRVNAKKKRYRPFHG